MRAREFISEQSLEDTSKFTLPDTHIFPKLPNQDPYLQYRMGLVLASSGPDQQLPEPTSPWGENMAIVAYSAGEKEIIKTAAKITGQPHSSITTSKSEEPKDTNKKSPVAAKKRNRYGI